MRQIRGYHEVADPATEDIVAQVTAQSERLRARLRTIHRIVVIGSGKGGVGKSALTANLASALARRGLRTGALDADLNGPSLARMLGASGKAMRLSDQGLEPVQGIDGVTLVSTELLLPDATPLGWRHPSAPTLAAGAPALVIQSMYEGTALRELLSDVEWGELDFLLVDATPGTDKLERLLQLLPGETVHLLVTTPSQIARNVVARSVTLLRRESVRAGLVVNMASHVCERCGHTQPLFGDASDEQFAAQAGIELWGSIPFDPRLATATDAGLSFEQLVPDAPAARALSSLATRLVSL